MSDPVLRLDGVTKGYGAQVPVLRGVDLTLSPGEAVALVAPSGAGKSTLLHIAGLLDQADGGVVQVTGADARGLDGAARTVLRRDAVGFVYQFHHLLPEFTALENVTLPQLAAGVEAGAARARAADLLASVGLAERAGHRPAALSGGEAQRVAICRALANRPALLLADEPTGNLDADTSERVFGLLLDLVRKDGLAALIATHDRDLAARMDRVVRLDKGVVV